MFGRRRDIQIPKVPVSGDKATQSWMTAVGSMLSKYIGGGSNDRLVSAGELIDGGLAGVGTGGFLTSPPRNLTKPPKVTGLTANGALASIFVSWHNPSFSNYAYTELWRSNLDDIGQAVLIASTAVESYTDNVGSAATKYYWARAVSDQGVKGDFNAASGTKGTTSLDPDYVMQVLTSSTWKPNTTYYPFQYVRPTVENGFQYAAVDGGKSGSVEPTWPLSVDPTVITNDGTVQWKCLRIDDRIPFVLGALEDGTPAVFMDTAYIKNATITSAKISELIADKITTGDLNADLHVLNKLWYGFNLPNGDFLDPEDNSIVSGKTGFYLGVNGSNALPVLHLNTGIANGSRRIYFDGITLKLENIDLVSSADGYFDDLDGDSVNFNRALFTELIVEEEPCTSSDYVREGLGIPVSDPLYLNYLCYKTGVVKSSTMEAPYLIVGGAPDRPYAFIQTPAVNGVACYDYADSTTKYRAKKKEIGFNIYYKSTLAALIGKPFYGALMWVYIYDSALSTPSNYYNNTDPTYGIPTGYLAKIALHDVNISEEFQTVQAKNSSGTVIFSVEVKVGIDWGISGSLIDDGDLSDSSFGRKFAEILINCETDNEALGYIGNRKLKSCIVFKQFDHSGTVLSGVQAGFQIDTTYQSKINIADNDPVFTV